MVRSLLPVMSGSILLAVISLMFQPSECAARSPWQGRPALSRVIIDVLSDEGLPIAGARAIVRGVNGAELASCVTGESGRCEITGVTAGRWRLQVESGGFSGREIPVTLSVGSPLPITVRLSLLPIRSGVTVAAGRGMVQEVESTQSPVLVLGSERLKRLPLPTIGHALEGGAGILLQQTGYGQISPFVRGLTGYQVLNLIDGIRFNNSTFRSGPNQYLAFIDPSQMDRIEVVPGPGGTQYGSDSMGGTISLATDPPRMSGTGEPRYRGEIGLFGSSADLATGGDAKISVGSRNVAWLGGINGRRHGDLRAGGGTDSHHALRRFFGLSSDAIRRLVGDRQQDTGFESRGWHSILTARLVANQHLTFRYQQSRLTGLRNYKDLWGGLGRLRSDLEPQSLNFFYARYEKYDLGWFDSLSATFSLNSQADGTARQGLRSSDRLIRDRSRVNSFGYIGQASGHVGQRQAIVFGGELYDEHIATTRVETDPVNGQQYQRRPLYPNGSRYQTGGIFGHDTWEIIKGGDRSPLRATFGMRYTRIGYASRAADNRDAQGNSLGVVDSSLGFADLTWSGSLAWQPTTRWGWYFQAGRGFRAPNLNDLGALGLNDLGFEVPAEAAVRVGALVGISDGEGVGSSGRTLERLRPERLISYELGTSWRSSRIEARTHVFISNLQDPIVRRTLLFPVDRLPASIAGLAVTPISQTSLQRAQGVASVATALDPRAIKAFVNEGAASYYGIESRLHALLARPLALDAGYSFIVGRELNPNRFARRLPPQQGRLALTWIPTSRISVELSGNFNGRQPRLSGGDLTDERIGASRRRRDISDFFFSARIRPLLQAGSDGVAGTADDIFSPTGETLARILDRVLPLGASINGVTIVDDNSRAPLFVATPGFAVFHLQGIFRISENTSLVMSLRNLLDKNYRLHGSGIDESGLNGSLGLRVRF